MSPNIHPTAIVSKDAKLAADVEIGPYCIIEDDVEIGRRVKIHACAHILSHTTIGDDCQIHLGAALGHLPQIRKQLDTNGRLLIGQGNIFREYTTVHRSSKQGNSTIIGNNNYLMAFSHVAHDCLIGNHATICNGALLAGHVQIEDGAFISGNVTIHQFCRIGKLVMVGGLARVSKDVPPYMLVKGDSVVWAINSVGLRRAGYSIQSRNQIKNAFKLLYTSGLNIKQALEKLKNQEHCSEMKDLINFIVHSKRGICDFKRPGLWQRLALSNALTKHHKIPAYQAFQARLS
ncbi:acyl-ACP--UDP-N-acetylglucosamine O-acyltransferase [Candidatus Omnitrophota bacterium]